MPLQGMPPELLCRIISILPFSSMLFLSRVCAGLRQAVFHDPKFCLDIQLDDLSERGLFWTKKRLQYSRGLPFDFTIDLREEHDEIESTVLVWICSCLHVVRRLRITLPSLYTLSLWGVMGRAAPNLESFELVFYVDTLATSVYHVPSNIFANDAPRLRHVKLKEVLPPLDPVPAFAYVTDFSLVFLGNRWQHFPKELFEFMPHMKSLTLAGGRIEFSMDSITSAVTSGLRQLEYLDITYNPNRNLEILQHLDTSDVRALSVVNADEDVVHTALTPLVAPLHAASLHMSITHDTGAEFHIVVHSESTRQLRRFVEFERNYGIGSTSYNAVFGSQAFPSQLRTLTIATSLWSTLARLLSGPYTELKHLIVFIDDPSAEIRAHILPNEAVPFPYLEVLTLQAKGDFAYVNDHDLISFRRRLTPRVVPLYLHRVLVHRSCTSLEEQFNSITYAESRSEILAVPGMVSGWG